MQGLLKRELTILVQNSPELAEVNRVMKAEKKERDRRARAEKKELAAKEQAAAAQSDVQVMPACC